MKTKRYEKKSKEIITLSIRCRLEWETEAGRREAIRCVREEIHYGVFGAGYSLETIEGSARVLKKETRGADRD